MCVCRVLSFQGRFLNQSLMPRSMKEVGYIEERATNLKTKQDQHNGTVAGVDSNGRECAYNLMSKVDGWAVHVLNK